MLMHIPKWNEDLQTNLTIAAVGFSSTAVLRSINRCWAEGAQLMELYESGGFELLDQSLSFSMFKTVEASGTKGRILLADLYARRTQCLVAGNLLPGRVVVKLFLDHFRTTDDLPCYTDYKHLEILEFNHSQPDLFMSKWREIPKSTDQ